ncbi:hypothetical protein FRAHR75_160072 [Frankia sp. Hr75.2]|nr:hypothetical protein FRAHR75_160072 [Frankia sp. Hr75.2]
MGENPRARQAGRRDLAHARMRTAPGTTRRDSRGEIEYQGKTTGRPGRKGGGAAVKNGLQNGADETRRS